MIQLLASHAISDRVVQVEADSHLGDVVEEIDARQATHAAVFEGGRFRGIVALNSVSTTQRIFGDLLPRREVASVRDDTPIANLGHQMQSARLDAVAVLDGSDDLVGVVTQHSLVRCLLVDSQRQLAQIAQLEAQQERLRVLGQMACGVAHELNNALTPVLGYLCLLRSANGLAPHIVADIDLVLTAANDAAGAVRRLQGFYGPAGTPGSAELVNVLQLLREVEALTRPRWHDEALAHASTIDFILAAPRPLWVKGNSGALRELFTNLVFNAADAMPSGGQITVRLHASAPHVVVEVTDTGCGMTEEQSRRCFEPFYTTKGERGTGLGLSVCQEIVLDHGGVLEVASEQSRGSTFRVLLPAEDTASVEEPMASNVSLLPWRVLYVDDDQRSRRVVERLLKFLGQAVDVARDAEAAIRLVRETHYDLLLTDLTMPSVNGMTLTQEVRKIRSDLPVVLLTGWAGSLALVGGPAESHPDAVLHKPLTVQDLQSVLGQVQRSRAPR